MSQMAMTQEFSTKREYVARWLREAIVSGELEPGQRILQDELATAFGMSPTPVREALRQLATEGYLKAVPHVGVTVSDVNEEGLEEVYFLRSLLEGHLAREAAKRMTDEDEVALRRLAQEFEDETRLGNVRVARRVNYQLHRHVWDLADQPITVSMVNGLWAKFPFDTLMLPGRLERSIDEHTSLLDALAARDPAGAERAIREHIRSGQSDYHLGKEGRRQA